jgi:hypothetical protein
VEPVHHGCPSVRDVYCTLTMVSARETVLSDDARKKEQRRILKASAAFVDKVVADVRAMHGSSRHGATLVRSTLADLARKVRRADATFEYPIQSSQHRHAREPIDGGDEQVLECRTGKEDRERVLWAPGTSRWRAALAAVFITLMLPITGAYFLVTVRFGESLLLVARFGSQARLLLWLINLATLDALHFLESGSAFAFASIWTELVVVVAVVMIAAAVLSFGSATRCDMGRGARMRMGYLFEPQRGLEEADW